MVNDLEALAARVRGSVLRPGDDAYDDARSLWNARIDRQPAVIVRCAGTADVIDGLAYAREHDLPVSVRGGGHHVAGPAVLDGAMMLDLSGMNDVRIDPAARTVRAGPGARVRDVDHEAQAFGLMTTGAPVTMVGIAGYTLGGGLGWTSRLHGLACDNLLSADVVTAAGSLVHASDAENPDLFWALRGGGGGFGVVTSFELRLHPLGPEVLAGPIVHPMSAAPALLRAWRDIMLDAPDALQCMPLVFALPPDPSSPSTQGDTVFALYPLWAGDPAEGEEHVDRFRALGSPLVDGVRVAPYATLLADLDDTYRAGHRNYYRSAFVDDLSDAAIDALVEPLDPVPTPFSSAFLEPLGGAIARRAPDATAFPHRQRKFCITAVPKWRGASFDAEATAWADRTIDALAPFAAEGIYLNYLDTFGEAQEAWGPNVERLRELRRRWDPDGLFRTHPDLGAGGSSQGGGRRGG